MILKFNEIHCRRAAVKQNLFRLHMETRIGFALEYLRKSKEFWRKVVYSDEKTFSPAGISNKFVYRKKGTQLDSKNKIGTLDIVKYINILKEY